MPWARNSSSPPENKYLPSGFRRSCKLGGGEIDGKEKDHEPHDNRHVSPFVLIPVIKRQVNVLSHRGHEKTPAPHQQQSKAASEAADLRSLGLAVSY